MSKPCVFCGSTAVHEDYVNPKIKSWVLRPYSKYPMCEQCLVFNHDGNDDALVDLIQIKWKRIQTARDDEKSRHKAILKELRASQVHNTIQKEVQNVNN